MLGFAFSWIWGDFYGRLGNASPNPQLALYMGAHLSHYEIIIAKNNGKRNQIGEKYLFALKNILQKSSIKGKSQISTEDLQ